MKTLRVVLALALLAGLVAFGIALTSPEDGTGQESLAFTSSEQCAACHSEIAREVAESWHGQAYTDPEALALTKNFQDEQCISCHAPAPVFRTGVGERVFERRENREAGVDCISCHLVPDGGVAGLRGLTDAPCRPRLEPRLGAAVFCAGCHNQHWTVDEYMASSYAKTHTCNDCHMPRSDRPLAEGGPVRTRVASHLFPGGHFPDLLRSAVTLDAVANGTVLTIRVSNTGAGHKVPTDSRHKSFNVYVTLADEEGNVLLRREEVAEYRLYYREQKRDSTQLSPGETRTHTFGLPAGQVGVAQVELVYCLKPPQKDDGTFTVVHRLDVPFGR